MLFTPLISLKTPMCFKTATSLKSHPIHPRTFISLILSYAQILLPASISHKLKSHLLFTRVSPSQTQISPSRLLPSRPFSSLLQTFTLHTLQTPMKPHKPPMAFQSIYALKKPSTKLKNSEKNDKHFFAVEY